MSEKEYHEAENTCVNRQNNGLQDSEQNSGADRKNLNFEEQGKVSASDGRDMNSTQQMNLQGASQGGMEDVPQVKWQTRQGNIRQTGGSNSAQRASRNKTGAKPRRETRPLHSGVPQNSMQLSAFRMEGSPQTQQEQSAAQSQQQIIDMASSTTKTSWGTIHCLTIVGQVEGHQVLPPNNKTTKYEHVMPLLAAVEESEEVDGLLLLLNTVGGDIEAGLGIAELVAGMRKPTVSLVLGGGHSIGVPLAVSAKRSLIVPSAAMTIHPVRLNGLVIGVPQTFNYFERIQERIVQFVVSNSKVKREEFISLMLKTGELAADVGSVIYGEDAVKIGLIDRIGGLSDALDELHDMIQKK